MTLAELNSADRAAFARAAGPLFEHSPWVAAETWERRPFATAESLHAALVTTMRGAERERQLALIRAHPDLAGRLAQQRQLTAASNREQASAGLDQLTEAELAEFQARNDRYRAKFGFPFVICARLNAKGVILEAMRRRLEHDAAAEHQAALDEIAKIAWLRLQDMLSK